MSYLSLREYGLIGNQNTVLLISRMGGVDWCCLPELDSPSHFSALLDENRGGQFVIAPRGDFHSEQRYIPRTNLLETHFETPFGRGVLLDWMPIEHEPYREPNIQRRLQVTEGEIEWVLSCTPRFRYGAESTQAEWHRDGILFRGQQHHEIGVLRGTMPMEIVGGGRSAVSRFKLVGGQQARFCWSWGRTGKLQFPSPQKTVDYWQSRAHHCSDQNPAQRTGSCPFSGPWHDTVVRSALVLRMMTAHFSGAVAESATTSLPCLTGGSKNWDYRYAWIRSSGFFMQALSNLGHQEEADQLFSWLSDILIRDGTEALQSVYTLDGGRFLPEHEVNSLAGYAGARPVRVGNLSARQFQLDVYGHVMLAAHQNLLTHGSLPQGLWSKLSEIAEYVCQAWRRPDRGPWESRAKPEHFVASKVLCWVALDRAIQMAQTLKIPIPNRWKEEKIILHRTILEQGYDGNRRSFVRAFGDRDLDTSALLIPLLGFLPPDDDRVQGTLDAIQTELSDGALLHLQRASEGIRESEGAHLLSSFWFVSCLALSGRADEASDRLAEICAFASPLGLFGELVDPSNNHPYGNFPSSSAHMSMINASLYVAHARGRKLKGAPLIGTPIIAPGRRAA